MKEVLHIYLRVSTQIQETEGTSLKTQKQSGIELSQQLGMDYQIHNEGGSSSNSDTLDNRPVMMNLLRLMDDGVVKNIYVWNTDRISRNQITFFTIRQKMIKNGVVLYTSGGRYNSENYMENMILGILSEVSQYDNKVRTERSRLGKIEKVKLNYWRGGDCPFGYKLQHDGFGSKLVENKEESKWVKLVFTKYSNGISLKEIKSFLESRNVKTRRGNDHWSLGSLQVMLRNDSYIGIDTFVDKKTGLTITNTIPQLISFKLWEEVQNRRNQILVRKNQLNKTKNFYLLRDFMVCSCGTPIGGRTRKEKYIQQYYCPLSERKFNKSIPYPKKCDMKRCLNIPITDKLIWNTIIQILSDSISIKEKMKEMGLFGLGMDSKELELDKKRILDRINQLQIKVQTIQKGLVETESKKLLNEFTTEEIYKGVKRNLTKQLRLTQSKVEDLNNQLKQIGNDKVWFEWVDRFGDDIRSKKDVPDPKKKSILQHVLQNIVVDYNHEKKVHVLTINFKIPVVLYGDVGSNRFGDVAEVEVTPPRSGRKSNHPISNYSTVTDFARLRG